MCDFVYSNRRQERDYLTSKLKLIFRDHKREYKEFHGTWGSLGIIVNNYDGYYPFENDNHIVVVIGGPLLNFSKKTVLKDTSDNTKLVYNYWKSGKKNWSDQISGPFLLFIIDKITSYTYLITDIAGMIPVYYKIKSDSKSGKQLTISTHVDITATVSGSVFDFDLASLADFLINRTICFPYTGYKNIIQCTPSSIYTFSPNSVLNEYYYLPVEDYTFKNISEAATSLRENLKDLIGRITENVNEVGLFISGGEDSRVICSSIDIDKHKKGWIYSDSYNREVKISQQVAKALNIDLKLGFRKPNHYLKYIDGVTALVGSHYEYMNVHTYGFINEHKIQQNQVILGGLLSDAFFKGSHIVTENVTRFKGFLKYQKIQNPNLVSNKGSYLGSEFINKKLIEIIDRRRQTFQNFIKDIRPNSSGEWSELWPSVMNRAAVNFYGNRRLFASYEPFAHNELFKISASIPQEWKINRQIFNKAFKKVLCKTYNIPHSDGHFPFFSYKVNRFLRPIEILKRKILETKDINQGSWPNYNQVASTREMTECVKNSQEYYYKFRELFNCTHEELFSKRISGKQQLIILQLLNSARIFNR